VTTWDTKKEMGEQLLRWILREMELAQDHVQLRALVLAVMNLWFLLTKHHAMKAYWGGGGIAPRIL